MIDSAKYKETELQASLLGKKLKPRPENVLNVSEEEENAQDKEAEALHNRLKQRYLARKVNGSE